MAVQKIPGRRLARPTAQGSTLLLTLVVTALAGLGIMAYLTLVRAQNLSTMRSQAWNAAIPVVEAGIEDALAHLNAHAGSSLACDGWTQVGNTYTMQRTVGDSFYYVTISNYVAGTSNMAPTIESRAFVCLPLLAAAAPPSGPLLASISVPDASRNYLGRGVRITTRQDALFAKGLVARNTIDLNGNNIMSDSFDSTDPNYSNNGLYAPWKRKANGDVATNSSLTNSLQIGNAKIYGHVETGPNGSVSIGPNGSVGDLDWQNANKKGIEPGYYKDDMNAEFPDVQLPFSGGGFAPSGGNFTNTDGTITYYDHILYNGNYQVDTLSGNTVVAGNAVLLVTSSISMSGHDSLVVNPGKSLKLYMAGANASLGGNGVVNLAGYATNFYYYGLPSNTSLSVSGNGALGGLVYAPNAALTLNGGGRDDTDFVGSAIVQKATMNGHFKFHYDESLRKVGPLRGFVVLSWDEMSPPEVNAVLNASN